MSDEAREHEHEHEYTNTSRAGPADRLGGAGGRGKGQRHTVCLLAVDPRDLPRAAELVSMCSEHGVGIWGRGGGRAGRARAVIRHAQGACHTHTRVSGH